MVQTADAAARDRLKQRLRRRIADGLAPEAHVRLTQLLFGPPVPWPVAFRVTGPDPDRLRVIAAEVTARLRADPRTRDVNMDLGEKAPGIRVSFDPARLRQIGPTATTAAAEFGHFTDDFAGVLALFHEVGRDVANQRDFAVADAAEDDHTARHLRLQRVHDRAQQFCICLAEVADNEIDVSASLRLCEKPLCNLRCPTSGF